MARRLLSIDAGVATAVWNRDNGSVGVIQSSSRPSGGSWTTPVDVSSPLGTADLPQLTVDSTGLITAVWIRNNGTNTIIQSSTSTDGVTWSTPVDLSAVGQSATSPQVTVDGTGTAIAVWTRSDGTDNIVQASTRPRGGSWSTPDDVSAVGQSASAPQVTVDGTGTAIAVWNRSNGSNDIVQSSVLPSGGSWSTPEDVSAPSGSAFQQQVTVDSTGLVTVIWNRSNGSNNIIQSSTSPGGIIWDTPVDLSEPLQDARAPQVVAGPNDRVIAVWERSNGTHSLIQSSSLLGSQAAALAPTGINLGLPLGVAAMLLFAGVVLVVLRRRVGES